MNSYIRVVAIYVDDLLIIGSSSPAIARMKALLYSQFNIKDLGIRHYYLGLKVTHMSKGEYHLLNPNLQLNFWLILSYLNPF